MLLYSFFLDIGPIGHCYSRTGFLVIVLFIIVIEREGDVTLRHRHVPHHASRAGHWTVVDLPSVTNARRDFDYSWNVSPMLE